ncbi:MAG: carboxypeptidase regulatory-like domain-containing protein [Planctomycetes bacterium]|nr:carboxypeptidase regulatory-like domain-containing protein [Planctomycetota bacterium]
MRTALRPSPRPAASRRWNIPRRLLPWATLVVVAGFLCWLVGAADAPPNGADGSRRQSNRDRGEPSRHRQEGESACATAAETAAPFQPRRREFSELLGARPSAPTAAAAHADRSNEEAPEARTTSRLIVHVVDENGTGVENADAHVARVPSSDSNGATTGSEEVVLNVELPWEADFYDDTRSHFIFQGVEPGKYRVVVTSPDHAPGWLDVVIDHPGDYDQQVTLEAGLTMSGVVWDVNRAPIAGAKVTLAVTYATCSGADDNDYMMQFVGKREVACDSEGRFLFVGLAPRGTYAVRAEAPHYAPSESLVGSSDPSDLTITLEKLASITGVVLTPDGKPVTGYYSLDLTGLTASTTYGYSDPIRTQGNDGTFTVDCPRRGAYVVNVRVSGFPPAMSRRVYVAERSQVNGLVIQLSPPGAITGRVVDELGQPVSDGAVLAAASRGLPQNSDVDVLREGIWRPWGGGQSAPTARDGLFKLDPLDEGVWYVSVHHGGHAPLLAASVDLRRGESIDLGTLTLSAAGAIFGVVADSNGQPLPGFQVRVSTTGPGVHRFQTTVSAHSNGRPLPGFHVLMPITGDGVDRVETTGPKGEYRVDGLPAGVYQVSARPLGQKIVVSEAKGSAVRLETGAEIRVDLALVIQPLSSGAILHGRVTRSGSPIAGARTHAWRSSPRFSHDATTDSQGEYEFDGVPHGRIRVTVFADRVCEQGPFPVEVPEGAQKVRFDIELNDFGPRGRVTSGVDGRPIEGAWVVTRSARQRGSWSMWWFNPATTNNSGSFRLPNAQEGEFDLVATADGFAPGVVERIHLTPGRAPEAVEIRLFPAAPPRRLVVKNDRGTPLSGAAVWVANRAGVRLPVASDRAVSRDAQTDSQGVLELDFLGTDEVDLMVCHEGYSDQPVSGVRADARDLEVSLRPAARMAVTVLLPNGQPASGAKVVVEAGGERLSLNERLETWSAFGELTDERGSLLLKNLPDGPVTCRATLDGYSPAEATVTLAGGVASEVVLALGQ